MRRGSTSSGIEGASLRLSKIVIGLRRTRALDAAGDDRWLRLALRDSNRSGSSNGRAGGGGAAPGGSSGGTQLFEVCEPRPELVIEMLGRESAPQGSIGLSGATVMSGICSAVLLDTFGERALVRPGVLMATADGVV